MSAPCAVANMGKFDGVGLALADGAPIVVTADGALRVGSGRDAPLFAFEPLASGAFRLRHGGAYVGAGARLGPRDGALALGVAPATSAVVAVTGLRVDGADVVADAAATTRLRVLLPGGVASADVCTSLNSDIFLQIGDDKALQQLAVQAEQCTTAYTCNSAAERLAKPLCCLRRCTGEPEECAWRLRADAEHMMGSGGACCVTRAAVYAQVADTARCAALSSTALFVAVPYDPALGFVRSARPTLWVPAYGNLALLRKGFEPRGGTYAGGCA
jgi:hypothetical protein